MSAVAKSATYLLFAVAIIYSVIEISFANEKIVELEAGSINMFIAGQGVQINFTKEYENGEKHWVQYRYKQPCSNSPTFVPTAYFNDYLIPTFGEYDDPKGWGGPCLNAKLISSKGGEVSYPSGSKHRIYFRIENWYKIKNPNSDVSVEIRIGSQTKTVKWGEQKVEFDDIGLGEWPMVVVVRGWISNGDRLVGGLLPLRIREQD